MLKPEQFEWPIGKDISGGTDALPEGESGGGSALPEGGEDGGSALPENEEMRRLLGKYIKETL